MLNEAGFQVSSLSCTSSFLRPYLLLPLPLNLHSSYNELCLDPENHQKEKQLSEAHKTENKKGELQNPDNLKTPGELSLVTGQPEGPNKEAFGNKKTTGKGHKAHWSADPSQPQGLNLLIEGSWLYFILGDTYVSLTFLSFFCASFTLGQPF